MNEINKKRKLSLANILITGCSSGIGLETALYLKQKGYRVFASARDQEDIDILIDNGFETFYLDVTKHQTITDTLNNILNLTEGKLDVVFNNAGFGQPGAVEDIRTDILKEQFETNVFGLHEVTRQVLPIMYAQGYGKIIQHSSVLGLISLKFRGAYNASKYAIEGLTDTLRLELLDTNIDVTLLNTGPVTSKFRENAVNKLKNNIDMENSRFKGTYEQNIKKNKSNVPFNLEAVEVAKVVERIIRTNNVKPRYYITKATYILGYLKRVLSTNSLDKILRRI
ncbi:MAG: SDR family NAD(P)-dependent oxidoreductase [Campylobacterota bacterium]|nr:SDR family NAD(P)-dependent oxidoreductase [Campylobacterota bacterium]